MKLPTPLNGYLIVKAIPNDGDDPKSGIYLPVEKDAEAQTSRCGIVKVCDDSSFEVGDTVYFSKMVPDTLHVDGDEYWFIKESQIKAIDNG